jgi:predicted dinucleotide-binding enzyme
VKIGVIGAGNVGGALGKLLARKGHEIVFGVRDLQSAKVQEFVKSTDGKARAATIGDAASFGELVMMATPWPATDGTIKSAGSLVGKILVDCTNPLARDLSGLVIRDMRRQQIKNIREMTLPSGEGIDNAQEN